MSTLSGTRLEFILRIFGVNTDEELISRMTWIGLWYTVSVGLYSFFFPAPYGRYASPKFGPAINARLAWMVRILIQNHLELFHCHLFLFTIDTGKPGGVRVSANLPADTRSLCKQSS